MFSLYLQDDFVVWEGEVTGKGKKRHLFLFKDKLMLTEVQKSERKGELPTYQYKEIIDVNINKQVLACHFFSF